MTIRSSSQATQNQKWRRAQTLCTLFRVTRLDGYVLRFTEHDRTVTFDGDAYFPASFGSITAERRESDMRANNQEARGVVDGNVILIPDLLGNKYRGAKVEQFLIDWRRPWVWHYKATKRIRTMSYDGSGWVATLEGLSSQMQQPVGGRFGGTHSQQCVYTLGDEITCKADITDNLIYSQTSITVATAGTTAIKVAVAGTPWAVNQWAGYYFHMRTGAQRGKERRVLSNTTNVLTLDSALPGVPLNTEVGWLGQGPRVATVALPRMEFTILAGDFPTSASYEDNFFRDGEIEWTTGNNVGTVSPIIEYDTGTRTVRLLLPTPFDIAANDRGILRPGCDGLLGTCQTKFLSRALFYGTLTTGGVVTVSDSALSMTVGAFNGLDYYLVGVAGSFIGQRFLIVSNTATQFTLDRSPFADPLVVGDKFLVARSNVENFGGTDVYSTGANKAIEQVAQ